MSKLNLGNDLYIKGRIGWKGLSKDEYLEKSDYKIINATALMDGYIDWNNCGYITRERYEESEEIMLCENDILISKDGTLGKIGYVKNLTLPATVASGIFVLRNTIPNILDFDYLYHILKSNIFKDFIRRNKAEGSTINHLYQRDLNNFEIDLPPITIQKKIAGVLNDLDDKIANNNGIISELESVAKTLYDYWFLQFEFPNEEGKPYKSSGGKMVRNEELKRDIPEGWLVGNLYDIATFTNGLACQKYRPTDDTGALPVIKITEMHDGITNKTEHVRDDIDSKYIINDGDILFSWSATLEVMFWNNGKGGLNQHIFKIEPKGSYNKCYVFSQLSAYVINFVKMAEARKTTMGHITSDHLKQSRIPLPPIKLANIFEKNVSKIFDNITNLANQNKELKQLRDFLLPMLMNGQVTFKKEGESIA